MHPQEDIRFDISNNKQTAHCDWDVINLLYCLLKIFSFFYDQNKLTVIDILLQFFKIRIMHNMKMRLNH